MILTDDEIRKAAEFAAEQMWPESGYVGWTEDDAVYHRKFIEACFEKLRAGVEVPEAFAHAAYKEQADNREWIAGVKSGRKIVDRMVDAVIGKAITDEKPSPLPPESLFELWWAEYLPEATQARAFEAWSRVDAAPQPAQPSDIGIPITQPEQGPST